MGQAESSDLEPAPPQPYHSLALVFVIRNGQYEPQYLMPTTPNLDTLFEDDGYSSHRPFRAIDPPELKKTSLIHNPTNIRKDALTLERRKKDLYLNFFFDCTLPVIITVSMLKTDEEHSENPVELPVLEDPPIVIPSRTFPAGMNQRFSELLGTHDQITRIVDGRDASKLLGAGALEDDEDTDRPSMGKENNRLYFVVEISVVDPDEDLSIRGQKTYIYVSYPQPEELKKLPTVKSQAYDSVLRAKVVSQTLSVSIDGSKPHMDGGKAMDILAVEDGEVAKVISDKSAYRADYEVQELYGLRPEVEVDGGRECIICMSEPRDTVVLPCRHICFCSHCANIMRTQCEKCPICRQRVASLLQFTPSGQDEKSPGKLPAVTSIPNQNEKTKPMVTRIG